MTSANRTLWCRVQNWRESRDRVGVTHDDRLQDPFEQCTWTLSREWPHSLQLAFDLNMLR